MAISLSRPPRKWLTSASQNGRTTPRISHTVETYSVGEVPSLDAHSVGRKLAAIFAADVEGYSRLMG